jgi:hypothetical protein
MPGVTEEIGRMAGQSVTSGMAVAGLAVRPIGSAEAGAVSRPPTRVSAMADPTAAIVVVRNVRAGIVTFSQFGRQRSLPGRQTKIPPRVDGTERIAQPRELLAAIGLYAVTKPDRIAGNGWSGYDLIAGATSVAG